MVMKAAFRAYVHPLTNVAIFKRLVQNITSMDNDWSEIVANLRKARKKWERVYRIIQAVLLFVLETWVWTPHVVRTLGGFHHKVY